MPRVFLLLGAINGALAVLLGAFGAHGLRGHLPPGMMEVYHTANQYHFYHALGLLAVGMAAFQMPESAALRWSGWLMLAGIVLFSGSLYALSVSGVRWLGIITPFGGTAFIIAWLLLAVAVWRIS
ncbi:MAG TPA: DUF423 domain-containing protein [Gammaproteobacteria bacterium]|nr:DUF423 domain-containing protein [Gammaproteobacteria bacterium]